MRSPRFLFPPIAPPSGSIWSRRWQSCSSTEWPLNNSWTSGTPYSVSWSFRCPGCFQRSRTQPSELLLSRSPARSANWGEVASTAQPKTGTWAWNFQSGKCWFGLSHLTVWAFWSTSMSWCCSPYFFFAPGNTPGTNPCGRRQLLIGSLLIALARVERFGAL